MSITKKKKIGIMGGTFDPIHYGHLYIAEASRIKFNLDKVLFIPSGMPVHKQRRDVAAAYHRVEMTRLATKDNPFFEVSTIETERQGPTYAVDTLRQLSLIANNSIEYYYITGGDTILDILFWKDVGEVFQYCRFIGVTRPGFSAEEMKVSLAKLPEEQREKVIAFETPGMGLSSTEIRALVGSACSIKYLLPDGVEKYIRKFALYKK